MLTRPISRRTLLAVQVDPAGPLVCLLSAARAPRRHQHSGSLTRHDAPYMPPRGDAHDASLATTLSRLPTKNIVRSLVLGSFLTTPLLFTPGFALLRTIATSKWFLLNPDKNLVLRSIIKPVIYDQFCAGTNQKEIRECATSIRSLGFSGVILAYGKEIQIYDRDEFHKNEDVAAVEHDEELACWQKGNLETLDMMQGQDFIGIKISGAGVKTTDALMNDVEPSKQLLDALHEVAVKASEMDCRVIIDAEQQALQKSIDKITVDLMRKYNRDGKALIYNSLQGYLKASRDKLCHQLALAQKEGWTLAIKLVRGAYINNDERSLIHDTKADTDASYNSIVRDVMQGTLPGFDPAKFPHMKLFVAGHNPESVDRAIELLKQLSSRGELKTVPEFGQLQGMADELGCRLLEYNDQGRQSPSSPSSHLPPVKVYKYLTWGSIQECTEYLVRRAVENRGAADRIKHDMGAMTAELRARLANKLFGSRKTA